MSEEELHILNIELVKLKEQWKAHGDSSLDFRNDIKKTMSLIQSDVKSLKDDYNTYLLGIAERREHCQDLANKYTNRAVTWALGVPGGLFILLKLVDMFYS